MNSLSLPNFTGPFLNTSPISYLLKGNLVFGFIAIYLANGTVKSYLKAKFLFP